MVDDVRKADNMLGETKSTHKESLNEAEIKRPSSSTELDESHAAHRCSTSRCFKKV